MDSDSSSERSSTDCSTDSSDDEKLETIQVCGSRLQIPQGLCEQKEIMQELFSVQTWNSLSDGHKQHLKGFLPTFPDNNEQERNITLQKLFTGETFRFTNPFEEFHEHLKAGHYRPDIAKMRYMIRKAERKETKCRYSRYREHLKEEIIESYQKLLHSIKNLPPGVEPRVEKSNTPTFTSPIAFRTKRRYFQEISAIRSKVDETGFSSDENYPEGPPPPLSRKQKRHLNSIKSSTNFDRIYISTMATKPNGLDLERNVVPYKNPFYVTEDTYKTMLLNHKRRKLNNVDDPELNTKGVTLSEIIQKTPLSYVKKQNNPAKHHGDNRSPNRKKIKKENVSLSQSPESISKTNPFFGHSSNSEIDSDSDSVDAVLSSNTLRIRNKNKLKQTNKNPLNKFIKTETKVDSYLENSQNLTDTTANTTASSPVDSTNMIKTTNFSQYGKITPATLSDLDGIDMMNLPIDLDDSNIDILDLNNKPELMQETHANFLSLIRDIICSTNEHRMNMSSLEERLRTWQENPISPLNDWYSLIDNWVALLQSAVNFLSGNFPEQPDDFVPYIEYKPQLEMYQWIGAGRDSDGLLSPLCQYWLEHRNEMKNQPFEKKEETEIEVIDRSQTPPPPRCPTTWSVRKADSEEIKTFREQERRRYDNPHKAFTYRCNGYESVVGPLKGIYNPSVSNTKARGHTMLSADRPNFVTILSLVRDATARLPNGEGTRADICELLKSSQYISSTAPENVLQSVVSGALDRMHTQFDPCVKYDPKRKIWIYLHRNRSEEDFERIHQQYQGMNKNMKKPSTKTKSATKTKPKSDKNKNPIKSEVPQNQTGDKLKSTLKVKSNHQIQSIGVSQSSSSGSEVTRPTATKQPGTSILLPSNKITKLESSATTENVQIIQPQQIITNIKRIPLKQGVKAVLTTEEKDINEALHAIQNSISKPVSKTSKSLVKIISPTQGKSLIIPSGSQVVKHVDQKTGTKLSQPLTQQLLQTLANQQKQTIKIELPDKNDQKQTKVPVSVQQQFLQTITSQQLQNIKNVTLLRNISAAQRQSPIQTQSIIASQPQTITLAQNSDGQNVIQTSALQKTAEQLTQTATQIRVQQALTPSQQQQLFQNLKQGRSVPVQNAVLTPQVILKQKTGGGGGGGGGGGATKQTVGGTSLLGQTRLSTENISNKPVISTSQTPLVAKVLTNTGHMLSVESLLAHQKQHGSLPQGTTLRVSGVKGGQANIIQLATPSKQSPITQIAVGSQNNYITISNQPKFLLSSQPTTSVSTTVSMSKPTSKPVVKTQTITKFPTKVGQQVINAKFITQNMDAQKIVQPKVIIGQNQIRISHSKSITQSNKQITVTAGGTNTNTIRMVNANLNLTHIGGKPVLLASKGGQLQNIQGQNVILQAQQNTTTSLVTLNSPKTISTSNIHQTTAGNVNLINQNAQVLLGSQIKVQQPTQVVLSSNLKQSNVQQTQNVMLGGHTVRLQPNSPGGTPQRVVLASQGQGGQIVAQQILLPAGFQGTAINIKALQGVKVIPITQQGKGVPGRQVFARVMNPSNIVRVPQQSNASEIVADSNVPTTE